MTNVFTNSITATQTASNNRGEGDGSTLSTLQKVITPSGEERTVVKAEAIRWGQRAYLQNICPEDVNRTYLEEKEEYEYKVPEYNHKKFIDDDFFGYMNAKESRKRKGCFETTTATSVDIWDGDVLFSAKGGTKDSNSLHACEVHHTAYQYGTALNLRDLSDLKRVAIALDCIENLSNVGGNQSRFKFDFSPASILIRITASFAPKFYGTFERINGVVECPKLIRLIERGDIPKDELILGGEIFDTASGKRLKELGFNEIGVCAAISQAKETIGA